MGQGFGIRATHWALNRAHFEMFCVDWFHKNMLSSSNLVLLKLDSPDNSSCQLTMHG